MECWLELVSVRNGRVRFEDHNVLTATGEVVVTNSELHFRSQIESMSSIRTRGKKVHPIATPPIYPVAAPGILWVKQPGHRTYDNDRPPIIHIISRETGEEYGWVVGHSDKAICQGILAEAVPPL
jgi:hypothetical protein